MSAEKPHDLVKRWLWPSSFSSLQSRTCDSRDTARSVRPRAPRPVRPDEIDVQVAAVQFHLAVGRLDGPPTQSGRERVVQRALVDQRRFLPDKAINRAKRLTPVTAEVVNLGESDAIVNAALSLPHGVELLRTNAGHAVHLGTSAGDVCFTWEVEAPQAMSGELLTRTLCGRQAGHTPIVDEPAPSRVRDAQTEGLSNANPRRRYRSVFKQLTNPSRTLAKCRGIPQPSGTTLATRAGSDPQRRVDRETSFRTDGMVDCVPGQLGRFLVHLGWERGDAALENKPTDRVGGEGVVPQACAAA